MAARLTYYERVVSILPREDKKKVADWCDTNRYSMAEVIREALTAWFKRKGVDICKKL